MFDLLRRKLVKQAALVGDLCVLLKGLFFEVFVGRPEGCC